MLAGGRLLVSGGGGVALVVVAVVVFGVVVVVVVVAAAAVAVAPCAPNINQPCRPTVWYHIPLWIRNTVPAYGTIHVWSTLTSALFGVIRQQLFCQGIRHPGEDTALSNPRAT